MSEKWEKEKKNLTEEHKKTMNKLKQDMETEKNKLQKELDQMVCFIFVTSRTCFLILQISKGLGGRVIGALGLRS